MDHIGNYPLGLFCVASVLEFVSWIVSDSVDPLKEFQKYAAAAAAVFLVGSPMILYFNRVTDPTHLAGGG
jgi:hypothetical protein